MKKRYTVVVSLAVIVGLGLVGLLGTAYIYESHGVSAEQLNDYRLPGWEAVMLLQNLTFWPAVALVGWLWNRAAKADPTTLPHVDPPPAFCEQCGWKPPAKGS